MAHLNVRERRVEATIAYLGPAGAGKATNVRQIGMRATPRAAAPEVAIGDEVGEVVSLDWTAPPSVQFRDCSLTVKLRAARGELSAARARAMIGGADGVVLILDAHPSAREANRTSAELVREVVAARTPPVPVIVQVNKADHPEALPAAEVAGEAAHEWPWLSASAEVGQGVLETLERALESVLVSLQETGDEAAAPARAAGPRVDGNPLLAALRQVLRETVREHVAELEVHFVAQLEATLVQRLLPIGEVAAEVAALRQTLVSEIAWNRTAIDELRERLETVRRGGVEASTALAVHSKETARGLAQQAAALNTLREGLPEGGAVEALAREVGALMGEVRADEQSSAARLTSLSAELRRSIGDDVDQRLTAMEELVRRAAAEAEQAGTRAEQGASEVVTRITALREEIARRDKRGWFG
jgi:signal recognition particle receptor subunit beta